VKEADPKKRLKFWGVKENQQPSPRGKKKGVSFRKLGGRGS